MIRIFATLALIGSLTAAPQEETLRRIHSFLLIEDPSGAVKEAENGLKNHPESRELLIAYGKALAAQGEEKNALQVYQKLLVKYGKEFEPNELLEEISWGILQKASKSSQYAIKMASLIGAYLTNDARAVVILQKMMRESSVYLRSSAVRLAGSYPDGPLQEEIVKLIQSETRWQVLMELLPTIGRMGLKSQKSFLEEILSKESSLEEKRLAIVSLVHMYERIDLKTVEWLAKSDRAGLRQFAAEAVIFFDFKEAKNVILPLIYDPRPDVRVAALNTLGLLFMREIPKEESRAYLEYALKDLDPSVSITAAWCAMLLDPSLAKSHFEKWLFHEEEEWRLMAASALAKTGIAGSNLSMAIMQKTNDPYVKINLAIGLAGQRKELKACCDLIYDFLRKEKNYCSFEADKNHLFPVFSNSRAPIRPDIPNFPEAVDQMTRLELVSILAVLGDQRAQPALKDFLIKKGWGITGNAATILLKEGDEEALQLVRALLNDNQAEVRLQAALVLAMYGRDESALTTLEKAYPKADHNQKLQILEALGAIGKPESCFFLARALEEPFEILRIAAASSLVRCLNK